MSSLQDASGCRRASTDLRDVRAASYCPMIVSHRLGKPLNLRVGPSDRPDRNRMTTGACRELVLKVAMSGPKRVVDVGTTALGKRGGAARCMCEASHFDARCEFGLSSSTCSMPITTPTLPATVGSTPGFFSDRSLDTGRCTHQCDYFGRARLSHCAQWVINPERVLAVTARGVICVLRDLYIFILK